jgi:hypothetical protein
MPHRSDDTDELDGRELPEPDPEDEPDGAVDTVACPFCKSQVYEDAEWCPHCRNYIFNDGSFSSNKPLWMIGGVGICLFIVLYWILRG